MCWSDFGPTAKSTIWLASTWLAGHLTAAGHYHYFICLGGRIAHRKRVIHQCVDFWFLSVGQRTERQNALLQGARRFVGKYSVKISRAMMS